MTKGDLVSLKVYDISGKEIATLVEEFQAPGEHEAVFRSSDLPEGVYFYLLRVGTYYETRRIVLMK